MSQLPHRALPAATAAFLAPNEHVDSDHPEVVAFARDRTRSASGEREIAVHLYYAVRDGIRYDPYTAGSSPDALRASATLRAGRGWCVGKAVLLAACCRALGIGARLGFADVRNHLSTARMADVRNHLSTARMERRWMRPQTRLRGREPRLSHAPGDGHDVLGKGPHAPLCLTQREPGETEAARQVEVPEDLAPLRDLVEAHLRGSPDLHCEVGVAHRVEPELA